MTIPTTPAPTQWTARLADVDGCPTATGPTPQEAAREAAKKAGIAPELVETSETADAEGGHWVGLRDEPGVIGMVYQD